MTNQSIPPLIDFFKHSKDPRVERNKALDFVVLNRHKQREVAGTSALKTSDGTGLRASL
jgi:hypothetical protein